MGRKHDRDAGPRAPSRGRAEGLHFSEEARRSRRCMELRLRGPFVEGAELRLEDDADAVRSRETALEFHGWTDSREGLDRNLDPLRALLREELAERVLAHGVLGRLERGSPMLALPH